MSKSAESPLRFLQSTVLGLAPASGLFAILEAPDILNSINKGNNKVKDREIFIGYLERHCSIWTCAQSRLILAKLRDTWDSARDSD